MIDELRAILGYWHVLKILKNKILVEASLGDPEKCSNVLKCLLNNLWNCAYHPTLPSPSSMRNGGAAGLFSVRSLLAAILLVQGGAGKERNTAEQRATDSMARERMWEQCGNLKLPLYIMLQTFMHVSLEKFYFSFIKCI